ncbi:PadR family transcriptional regulator [Streptomyces sirii]|uniref:PadR family transcriptional regulator n=1 Tax=Streptomyces sirii TaxID=3127701 RepID=UPI003D3650FF
MSLRHAVLGLLAESPASGYDLMKLFNASLSNVWPATQSQVYGELTKLTTAGLVEVAAHGPRGRKEYAITEDGLAELRHWLTDVPPGGPTRDDSMLRVFFLGIVTPSKRRRTCSRRPSSPPARTPRTRKSLRTPTGTRK